MFFNILPNQCFLMDFTEINVYPGPTPRTNSQHMASWVLCAKEKIALPVNQGTQWIYCALCRRDGVQLIFHSNVRMRNFAMDSDCGNFSKRNLSL